MLVKEIILSNGSIALCDEGDYPMLSAFNWYPHKGAIVYAKARIRGKQISMHRLLLNAPSNLHVDHINGNGLDNRRENIRLCSRSENMANSPRRSGSKSQYKGVSVQGNRFRAQGSKDRKIHYLGLFTSEIEAAKAYDAWAKEYHGQFARLNFPC